MWSDWLFFCDHGFSHSTLWCPLSMPTVLLGFLLPSCEICLHGCSSKGQLLLLTLYVGYLFTASAPDLVRKVSSHGFCPWPWTWGILCQLTNIIQTTKIKNKEQMLKAAREKQQITHKGIPIRITADFSIETLQARREWQEILKVMKENNLQPRGSHSNMKEKSKALQTGKSWENSARPNQLSNKC